MQSSAELEGSQAWNAWLISGMFPEIIQDDFPYIIIYYKIISLRTSWMIPKLISAAAGESPGSSKGSPVEVPGRILEDHKDISGDLPGPISAAAGQHCR